MPTVKNASLRLLSDIIHWDKYAAFLPDEHRRETHTETTHRCRDMHRDHYQGLGVEAEINEAFEYVQQEKVLPSMRSFQFGGPAIERNPARMYNCSATHIDSVEAFAEGMFLLLSGCGFGYSVQSNHVNKLPVVQGVQSSTRRHLVADSIEGWADAVKTLLECYFYGRRKPVFDFSDIRPKGSLLITSGGQAPGPQPLITALGHIERVLQGATGRQLTTVECHDILCYEADAVLSGGIRRAAMISLFDLDDVPMIKSKSNFEVISISKPELLVNLIGQQTYHITYLDPCTGEEKTVNNLTFYGEYEKEAERMLVEEHKLVWWKVEPQRGRANNSAVIVRKKLTRKRFNTFYDLVMENGSGDPGFMFTDDPDWLINPCGEASIRPPGMFCNLTTLNADGVESQHDLNMRARMASRIGVLQAGYTHFHYLRPFWQDLTEEDAQLGVSITGIASGDIDHLDLAEAAMHATDEAHTFAKRVGVNVAARVTLIKPEGTTSLKLMTSSGAHDFFARNYFRRVGMTKGDPLHVWADEFVPEWVEQSVADPTGNSYFIRIPIAAPEGAKVADEATLQDFLDRVDWLQRDWVALGHFKGVNSHNVSATAYVRGADDWELLRHWVWDRRHKITGISVLPVDDNTYVQAPYEKCTEEEYEAALSQVEGRELDLRQIYEERDMTDRQGELACSGPNGCEAI
jgi:ribonucleoside-triphosphate reductase (thioredoxin)